MDSRRLSRRSGSSARRAWLTERRLRALSLAVAALLAGCSSGSSDTIAPAATASTSATSPAATTAAAIPPAHPGRRRRAGAHAGAHRRAPAPPRANAPTPPRGLPISTADPNTIQPQPPPSSCHARGTGLFSLPDPRCTPGALDSAVTQANINQTICRGGFTKTIRPPESITEPEKEASLAAYGDPGPLHDYEYDHLVPLELGGAPNDPRNLWPEPGAIPNPKDALENELRAMVCDGSLTLDAAQLAIASDWVAAYRRLRG